MAPGTKADRLKNRGSQLLDDLPGPNIAEQGFNALAGAPVLGTQLPQQIVGHPTPINQIYPDLSQPRRTIPSAIRMYWDGEPSSLPDLFALWAQESEKETGQVFPLEQILATAPTEDDLAQEAQSTDTDQADSLRAFPITYSLTRLTRLAASILHHSLTNPITVVNRAQVYRIDTGERRWLAFHLLYAYTKDKKWTTIPAVTKKEANRWRQAEENSSREALTAIGRARQLALLLMDVLDPKQEIFTAYDDIVTRNACDRLFYAQVADGDTYRVPRGQGSALLSALDLVNPVQIRNYRALLRLPDPIWTMADDYGFPERALRPLTAMAPDDAIQALNVLIESRAYLDTVSMDTVSTEEPPSAQDTAQPQDSPQNTQSPSTSKGRSSNGKKTPSVQWLDNQFLRLGKRIEQADQKTRRQMIQRLEQQLEALKAKYQ